MRAERRLFLPLLLAPALAAAASAAAPSVAPPSSPKPVPDILPILSAAKAAGSDFDPSAALAAFEALVKEAAEHGQAPSTPEDPAAALDRLYRFLFREKRWEAVDPKGTAPIPLDALFVSGVLRDGRGTQPALSITLFLLAERAGIPARLWALPERLLISVPTADGPLFLDPMPLHGPPFLAREALVREAGMLDGMKESDALFPLERGQIPAYLRARLAIRLLAVPAHDSAVRARDLLAEALKTLPLPEILYAYGTALAESGEPQKGLDTLTALAQNPSFFRAKGLAQAARIYTVQGNAAKAREALAEAEKLSPSEPLVPCVRALLTQIEGRWPEAAREFEAAAARAPEAGSSALRAAAIEAAVRSRLRAATAPGPNQKPADLPYDPDGVQGADAARARVLELLRGTLSQDPKVAPYCMAHLLRMEGSALPGLLEAVALAPTTLRLQAVKLAPSVLPDRRAHAILGEALRDPDLEVRLEAVKLIAKLGARETFDILVRLLEEAAGRLEEGPLARALCRETAYALLAFDAPPAVQRLCLAQVLPDLDSTEPPTRARACTALSGAGGTDGASAVAKKLTDADAAVRAAAAETLGRIGEESAVEPLIAALSDEDPAVRAAAAKSLERITRQPFGEDAAAWTAWQARRKDD